FADYTDPPTVVLYQTPHRQYIRDSKLNWFNVTATFSEPVIGFSAGDMVIGGSAQDADPWDVPEIMGESGGSSYGFSLENGTWVNGILTLQLPEGAVTDLAGNPVQASNVITI